MNPGELNIWLDIVIQVLALFAGLVGGLWAYTKFIVERGLLPPVEFTIDCHVVGRQMGQYLIEILLHLKNLGGSTLVATDITVRLLYVNREEQVDVFTVPEESRFARARMSHSRSKEIADEPDGPEMISIVPHDTFVRPGVNQSYTLVTTLPDSATFVVVKGQFRYAQRPSTLQLAVIKLSRRLGLTHYSLDHVTQPHTVERAFALRDKGDVSI